MTDPALALLAEMLGHGTHLSSHDRDEEAAFWLKSAERYAATEPGTRLLAALRSDAEKTELLELAWGIIANAGGGNWYVETAEWQDAAARWRDRYFAALDEPTGAAQEERP